MSTTCTVPPLLAHSMPISDTDCLRCALSLSACACVYMCGGGVWCMWRGCGDRCLRMRGHLRYVSASGEGGGLWRGVEGPIVVCGGAVWCFGTRGVVVVGVR